MNNKQLEQFVYFTQETATLLKEGEFVETNIINTALKLIRQSKKALDTLGEFASIIIDDDGLYVESREFYHPSQFSDLNYDLCMFEEMLSYIQEHISDPDALVGIFTKDEEIPVTVFYLREMHENIFDENVLFEEPSAEDAKLMQYFMESHEW